jgi:hypothetical protein
MITEADMSYGDMIMVAKEHTCGQCLGLLNVAWGGSWGYNGHILRCSNDITHNTITSHDKEREAQIRMIKEIRKMDTKNLMAMNETQMMERVNTAKFPQDLTPQEKILLARVAISYGLDPIMKELVAYQGSAYITTDGRFRKAHDSNEFDGISSRPATKQEKSDWEIPEGDYFFRAEAYRKGISHPFVGWGRVRVSETRPGSRTQGDTTSTFKPVQNNPQRMAEKRAESQALRKGFPIDLPSAEEIGGVDEEYPITVTVEPVVEKKPKATKKTEVDKSFEVIESTMVSEPATAQKEATSATKTIEQEIEEHIPSVAVKPEEKPFPIDMFWLQDSLTAIQKKKLAGWTNTAVVNKLNNITGGKAGSVRDAVALLTPQLAKAFEDEIKETLEML